MLEYLRIRNLALLDDVEIHLGDGLNLLTGETGAGKSIVLDAMGLALGRRASADQIRTGEVRAVVEAIFRTPEDDLVRGVLRDAGIDEPEADGGGASLIIRRELSADGSRGFVNGSPVTMATLRRVGDVRIVMMTYHERLSG